MVLDMDKTKTVAVAVVVVIVAVAAVAAVVYTNNNDEGNRYDTSKGWYSWDPIAMETKTAYFSITPLLITAAEGMYEEIYGSVVLVIGMLNDKDADGVVSELAPMCSAIYVTPIILNMVARYPASILI